jgi:hypothetical protein
MHAAIITHGLLTIKQEAKRETGVSETDPGKRNRKQSQKNPENGRC